MNKFTLTLILVGGAVMLAVGGVLLLPGASAPQEDNNKLKVATTIYPLYDIVRNVAGENADVQLILPSGASPHLFEFSPRGLAELQGTKLIFAIGHGLDDWTHRVEEAIPQSEIRLVDAGIELRETFESHEEDEDEDEEHEDEHGPIDPHYWLNFGNAQIIANNVASQLSELNPENREEYMLNAREYGEILSEKDSELRARMAPLEDKNIVTLHDAWFYFAENFGLNVVGTFEPVAGQEPTAQFLSRLINEIREHNTRIIFGEPQLASSTLRNFARDNNLALAILDPLGGQGETDTFIGLMEYNVNAILNALNN